MGWIRIDTATKQILHLSEPPFTVPPPTGQTDIEIPGSATEFAKTVLNGEPPECWAYDAETGTACRAFDRPMRQPRLMNSAVGYYLTPPVWVVDAPPEPSGELEEEEVLRLDLSVGFKVGVQRRGVFMFDFGAWPPGQPILDDNFDKVALVQLQRVQVLNAHLVCLHSSLSEKQNVAWEKMDVDLNDLVIKPTIDSLPSAYAGTQIALLAWRGYRGFPGRQVLERQTVIKSLEKLEEIIRRPQPALELVALLNRAAVYYEEHNYPLSVVTAWTISERLLNLRWDDYLEANRVRVSQEAQVSFINADRKKKLKGADFTASIVSEILSLVGQLPFGLFKQLEDVRRARNGWLHDGDIPTRQIAELAVDSAREMIAEVLNIPLQLPLVSRCTF